MGVISYRTNKDEKLKKIAFEKKMTVSQLSTNVIDNYLYEYDLVTKYDMIRDTRKMISLIFDLVSDQDMDKVLEVDSTEVVQSLKSMTTDFSFENILNLLLEKWFNLNNFKLEQFVEEEYVKFACKNTMGKNWNIHQAKVFVRIFENFGFKGNVETAEENLLLFRIMTRLS